MVAVSLKSRQRKKLAIPFQFFITILFCVLSYYIGTLHGIQHQKCDDSSTSNLPIISLDPLQNTATIDFKKESNKSSPISSTSQKFNKFSRFPDTVSQYMNGVVRINKDDFASKFDYGIPMDNGKLQNSEVLLFYTSPKALPASANDEETAKIESGKGIPLLSVNQATENCDTMNVINLSNPGNTRQCLAVVGNYEAYHMQRWMRAPLRGPIDSSFPLRAVSRGHLPNGQEEFKAPKMEMVQKHWDVLKTYFESLDSTIEKLKPLAESVARDNTIIVLTCNMGQSELLVNFVCNAKARGLLIDNVLVFPTDKETKDLAEGLGLKTYYHEEVSHLYDMLHCEYSIHLTQYACASFKKIDF